MTNAGQARALVLSRIRAGLGVAGRDRTREAAVEEPFAQLTSAARSRRGRAPRARHCSN